MNPVSIHNGLVTILWSFALLIALAASVRFPPYNSFLTTRVLTRFLAKSWSVSLVYLSIRPSGDLINRH